MQMMGNCLRSLTEIPLTWLQRKPGVVLIYVSLGFCQRYRYPCPPTPTMQCPTFSALICAVMRFLTSWVVGKAANFKFCPGSPKLFNNWTRVGPVTLLGLGALSINAGL